MSFGAIADDYDRLRPRPREAAVDWLLPVPCRVAVDVGAGTGLLSRALAGKVERVVAVEPDERMRAVLRARSPGAEVMAGRGEAIPLPDASADGVFVSSAWHWMDPDLAVPEIARVLRDGGRFGVIWTTRDHQAARPGRREVKLPAGAQLRDVATKSFRFTRRMTIDDLVDMLATYSGFITASQEDRVAGLARARAALSERFSGASQVDVPMRSWCWRADRIDRSNG
jgi:ubiquinone/menaquinone biosynthesis C-methylase UbiE